MRVLITTDYFPPHTGGLEQVVYETARRVARIGAEVTVVTLRTAGGPSENLVEGVRVVQVPCTELTAILGLQAAVSTQIVRVLSTLVRDVRPSLVHAHGLFFQTSVAAAVVARRAHIPFVLTLHLGSLDAFHGLRGTVPRAYECTVGRWLASRSTLTIGVSETSAAYARRLGSSETMVIPNAVDLNRFTPGEADRPVVAVVCRLVANKGVATLIDAAPAVLALVSNAEFIVAGDGPQRRSLEVQARRLGVAHAVRFLGVVGDIPAVLRAARVVVRPSYLEGMPLAILEAMAAGKPVVATRIDGNTDVVLDGTTGLLVPPGDPEALSQAVVRILQDPNAAAAMGQAARDWVMQLPDWDAVALRTLKMYRKIAAYDDARRPT